MTQQGGGSLFKLSILFFVSNLSVNILMTLILYLRNSEFRPRLNLVSFKLFKKNFRVSLDFFLINISSVVIFSTDTIMISHLFGAEHVVSYSVTLKIFSAFLMVLWFYTAPLWSAYSEKFHKNDFNWILKMFKRSLGLSLGLFIVIITTFFNFEKILELWVGDNNYYDVNLVLSISLLISIRIWNGNFSTLLNGLGLTSLQMKLSIITMFINIPLSILLAKYLEMGISGIAYGSSISLSLFAVISPFYIYNYLKNVK